MRWSWPKSLPFRTRSRNAWRAPSNPSCSRLNRCRAGPRHSGNVTAWDLVRQGTWHFHHVGRESHFKARDLFRRACELDPELAEAHIWVARVSAGVVAYGWSEAAEHDIREGLDAALTAIQLDERNPYSHYALAISSAYANAPEQAVLAAEKAIEVSPSFALGHLVLGLAQLIRGSASKAVAPLERGLTLSAYDPQNFAWYNCWLLRTYLLARRAGACRSDQGAKGSPGMATDDRDPDLLLRLARTPEDARSCVMQMSKLQKPPGDTLGPLRLRNPQWAAQINSLLKSASGQ